MFKKLILSLITVFSLAFAQNISYGVAVNPLGLIFGILNGQVEIYKYKLSNDLYPTVGGVFYYYSSGGWDIKGGGVSVGVIKFLNKNQDKKGTFVSGGVSLGFLKATYEDILGNSADTSATSVAIYGGVGYRFMLSETNLIYLDLAAGLELAMGGNLEVTINNQKYETNAFSGILPVLGFDIGKYF